MWCDTPYLYAFTDPSGAVSLISIAIGRADRPRKHKKWLADTLDDTLDALGGLFSQDLRKPGHVARYHEAGDSCLPLSSHALTINRPLLGDLPDLKAQLSHIYNVDWDEPLRPPPSPSCSPPRLRANTTTTTTSGPPPPPAPLPGGLGSSYFVAPHLWHFFEKINGRPVPEHVREYFKELATSSPSSPPINTPIGGTDPPAPSAAASGPIAVTTGGSAPPPATDLSDPKPGDPVDEYGFPIPEDSEEEDEEGVEAHSTSSSDEGAAGPSAAPPRNRNTACKSSKLRLDRPYLKRKRQEDQD